MLTQKQLKNLFHYEPETGVFTRLVSMSNAHKPGVKSGGLTDSGYVRIQVLGVSYRAHRLAWLYMTGEWPKGEIDHRNGTHDDNKWKNLRDVSRTINQQNIRHARRDNKLCLLGVSTNKKGWKARVNVDGKCHNIGTFSTPELAHAAYLKAKRRLHEGCTI